MKDFHSLHWMEITCALNAFKGKKKNGGFQDISGESNERVAGWVSVIGVSEMKRGKSRDSALVKSVIEISEMSEPVLLQP